MTDHELLEKAAKAAGIQLADDLDSSIPSGGLWVLGRTGRDEVWNPLESNGDAFRLMVEMNIGLETYSTHVFASPVGNIDIEAMEWYEGDRLAATRRAIVCAAAAMGDAQ